MSESLANLQKKSGAIKPISLEVLTQTGTANVEGYAYLNIPDTHKYTTLKVVGYTNISYALANYPFVTISGVRYNRPAENSEYDVKDKTIEIGVLVRTNSTYKRTGITVELS